MLSGDRIKFLRYTHGRTQKEIADWCNLSVRYIRMVETNEHIPTQETYENILRAIYKEGQPLPKIKKTNSKRRIRELDD